MTLRGLAFLTCALLAFSSLQADENYAELFEQALKSVSFDFQREWAYTETSVSDGRVWVGRFDPRNPRDERWTLQSVDGQDPTDDEIEEFLDDRDEDDDGDDGDVEQLVEADTIRLVEETDDYYLLSFIPDEDEVEFLESVDATIRINKPDGYLEYIDVHNNSTIKPTFGVNIAKLITRFTFGPAAADGPIVPLSLQVEVKGRAYLLFSFDEQELKSNSDFEFAGDD